MGQPVPDEKEVLVKVRAAALNYGDWYALSGKPLFVRLTASGLFKPKARILGNDIAGVVEAVGNRVTDFEPGDPVYADISDYRRGGLAEYVAVPTRVLARKPGNLSFEEAAAVPMAAVTALQGLRDEGKLQAGQKALIVGASGGVGSFIVQIAKALGAEVTAVCSTGKVEVVRSLGADNIIDYKTEDFTQSDERFDLVVAVNGYRPLRDYQLVLKEQGRYVCSGGTLRQIFETMLIGGWAARGTRQTATNLIAKPNRTDLETVTGMIEAGEIHPLIDKSYPLDKAQEAFHHLGGGHAMGKIVIQISAP